MADLLDMARLNAIPQPLWDGDWPIQDIDVESGLYRIDVCGLLEARKWPPTRLKDADGAELDPDDFYTTEPQP